MPVGTVYSQPALGAQAGGSSGGAFAALRQVGGHAMSAPRRWVDDPDADESLRDVLRATPRARPLDAVTRRRLSAKVARAAALPRGCGRLVVRQISGGPRWAWCSERAPSAVATGVVEWSPQPEAPAAVVQPAAPQAQRGPAAVATPAIPVVEPTVEREAPVAKVNPTPATAGGHNLPARRRHALGRSGAARASAP